MALRILAGVCVFGAAWYAVDKWQPGLLPRIDFANKFAALRASPDASGRVARSSDHEAASSSQGYSAPVGQWKKMESVSYEKIMDRVIPEDLRILYRAARRALERVEWPEWTADVDWDKACVLLLSSVLWVVFATWYFRGVAEDNKKGADAPPEEPVRATGVGCKSSLGLFEMARHPLQAHRHEGGYIYSQGNDQFRKEDAAAAIIQRWARTEFKSWLRDRVLPRSSIETAPLEGQRWIDEDNGAVVSTFLKDPCADVRALVPPESELCSDAKVAFKKRLLEIARRGSDHVDSSEDHRCRKNLALSSVDISKVLLRLETSDDPPASLSAVSKPS